MADTSSSVKVMRAMVEAPHSCNSGSAVVLRGKRLQTSVSSYAAAGIIAAILPLGCRNQSQGTAGTAWRGAHDLGPPHGSGTGDAGFVVFVPPVEEQEAPLSYPGCGIIWPA